MTEACSCEHPNMMLIKDGEWEKPSVEPIDHQSEEFRQRAVMAEKRVTELAEMHNKLVKELIGLLNAIGPHHYLCTIFEEKKLLVLRIKGKDGVTVSLDDAILETINTVRRLKRKTAKKTRKR